MESDSKSENKAISFKSLLNEIPAIAKFILFGLLLISVFVISDFIRLVLEPGPLLAGEDLYIHVAMIIMVPFSCLAMFTISFGYAYYQICKRLGIKPFWDSFF